MEIVMSESEFHSAVGRMPELFALLMSSEPQQMMARPSWKSLHAIYVFYNADGQPCHTGRTRNLQARIRSHTANSHHAASLAFKNARHVLNRPRTYRPEGSRAKLMEDPVFRSEFDRQRGAISQMTIRYVEIKCPIEQYLFEIYVALRLETSLTEFSTS